MGNSQIPNQFRYSEELLTQYSIDALDNASQLIEEADLLFQHGRLARSYYLAVAAIEEIGKSFLAFDALGRNLNDSAVTAKVRSSLESHSRKITAAFNASVISHSNLRDELEGIIDLMISLKRGREPSMYTDINYLDAKLYRPKDVVREVAARDCIRLARHCYAKTAEHLRKNEPTKRSANEDRFYGMKDRKVNDLFNTEDFWWYHISRMEQGENDLADSITLYQREYQNKGRTFQDNDT
jgi:AbiV family abortive infection protein